MGEVDPAFVQAIDQRPKLKSTITVDDEIPIIDLSVLSSSHGDTNQLVSQIGHACQKWGFFQVVNHGLPMEFFKRMEEVGKKFFELPLEEKKKVKRDMVNALGYHDGEHTKNVRDWKEVFDYLVEDMTMLPASHEPDDKELRILTNQWPQYPPEFREVCEEYAREVEKLAYKLLGLIALSLGQPENKFDEFFKDHQTSLIRFNRYPPCPFPHLALGVGRHKDAGALTILAQDDVGGLEVRRKSDGEWIPVTPTPNAFIINVGDMVQVWSNDKYESVEHRVVVNTEKERFSIPFFFFPAHHVMVKPLEELLNDDNPAKYREYNWGKFFAMRNRSDFKKLDVENIQIHHFRLQETGCGEVDPAFIQNPEHRPKLSIIEAEGIPLIDLSPLTSADSVSDPKAIEVLVREIGNACKSWGFFQVINHGVPLKMLEKVDTTARKFFAQPLEEKRKIRRDEKCVVGYYDTEHTKNVRDWKEVFDFLVEEPTLVPSSTEPDDKEETQWFNQWPENPPELREVMEDYSQAVEKLSLKLMGLIALSLGLPEDRFKGYFKDQTSFVRLNHYPPCPSPQLALGVGRHKDGGALTVLAQDEVGGLEVKRKTDGEWIRVRPTPNAYIINVGDIIQVWSNDKYESVEHRVMVNSEKERFSVPFFLNPAHYTEVKPLEELTNKQNPAKYRPYSWGKFLTLRKLSNFKKLKAENIQIYHFKVSG